MIPHEVYEFGDKSISTIINEILHLDTGNGNKMLLLLDLIKLVKEGEKE